MTREDWINKNSKFLTSTIAFKEVPEQVLDRTYIVVECSIHGDYRVRQDDFKHRGCKHCTAEQRKELYDLQWKEECSIIHNNKYDYSNTTVGDVLKKSSIFCTVCDNYFDQTPASHKRGQGCPTCMRKESSLRKRKSIDSVIKRAKDIGFNYDFSESEYITCKDDMKITCDKGHIFFTTPDELLNAKHGCPFCSKAGKSSMEKDLFDFISQYYECEGNVRYVLGGREIDIYIPEIKVGIEFNGLYWHSDNINKGLSHRDKKNLAVACNVHLIHIYEDEWTHRKQAVKNKLINILQIRREGYINAPLRKTSVEEITDEYHIENYKNYCLEPELSYDGIKGLRFRDHILAYASYQVKENHILIKEIVRNPDLSNSNYYELFLQHFIIEDDKYKVLTSIDWIEYLYFKKVGICNHEGITTQIKKYIRHNKSFIKEPEKYKNTITKPGYAIFKL